MKKIINWLYSKGDNCSDFQKDLRTFMFLKEMRRQTMGIKTANEIKSQCSVCRGMDDESVDCENCNGTGYELSSKEKELLSTVTNLAF